MELGLAAKVVLISGGTSGIGLEVAKEFLQEGAAVVLMGRSRERGLAAVESLRESAEPERILFCAGDVRSEEDCRQAVAETVLHFGRLDVLVNSAGIYKEGALEDLEEETLTDILDINVKGVFHLSKAALPHLKRARGNIVNVASDAGVHGNYFCAAYCASKGAVVLFTRALALETAAFGVRVNAIAPGDILTPLTEAQLGRGAEREKSLQEMASVYPLGRIGTPAEAASLAVFLASARASFVTGAVYGIDGGLTA
ncbi:MAG: SDR family NAD(P)-dependent oxidoreductase [Mitsuokella sp.]|uniref:SDR family NAD(P)-dependent oxidoreductase n=1 Tax=Mitsuokella sp. TaxID=2049034 RepID=UPI003D7C68EB